MADKAGGASADERRGRSFVPQRGSIMYSSLRLRVSSQERGLHMSPDRITRHASPSRYVVNDQEVVPRIPQPYRTSFSAVTSPKRVARPTNLSPLSRSCPLRSTMPERSRSADPHSSYNVRSSDSQKGTWKSKHSLDSHPVVETETSRGRKERTDPPKMTSRSVDNMISHAAHKPKMEVVTLSEVDINDVNKSLLNGDKSVREFMSISNGTIPTQPSEEELDVISNPIDSVEFTEEGTTPDSKLCTFEVEAKKLISREYVHVKDISYFKALEKIEKLPTPNEETEKLVNDMLKTKKYDWRMRSDGRSQGQENAGLSLPTSPNESPKGRQTRSGTLPSETLLAGKPMASTPVKKSLSTSITNFFKRMSPKSLRRSPKGSDRSRHSGTPGSSSGSLHAVLCDSAEDLSLESDQSGSGSQKSKGKSPKSSPIRNLITQSFRRSKGTSREPLTSTSPRSSSKDLSVSASKELLSAEPVKDETSPSVLPSESARILKSIENNTQATTEKSVYQAFKEKQSPKRVAEAFSMKPQALKAVEIPDQLMEADPSLPPPPGDEVDRAILPLDLDNVNLTAKDDSPKVASLPGTLTRLTSKGVPPAEPMSAGSAILARQRSEHGNTGGSRRPFEPPKTLDVRKVAKLQKGVFMFPNMSAESIGQCSVNLYTSGSEPSLVSRNGHRSETASKRTLISQETDPSPRKSETHSSSDISHRSGSQPMLLDEMPTATMSNSSYDSSMDTTPKTPSYMKISCSLSGYNRYNTYTSPKQEAKLKVLKLSTQNGSHSSLSSDSQSECSEVRGHEPRSKLRGDIEPITNGISPPCVQNGGSNVAVTNGRTEVIDGYDRHRFVTKATVKLEPAANQVGWSPELKLPVEDKRKAELRSTVSTPSPSKDGHYYFPVLDREIARITVLCAEAELDLEKPLSEEVSGRLRACVGKANLVMKQKFKQFRGLCEHNINQASDEQYITTVQDLAGFWDMVSLQISDIDEMFGEIEQLRKNGWTVDVKSPVQQPTKSSQKPKSPRNKETPKSAKASEAAKARDEARRRLMAAKRAGRQRKASQSDKEEIEIFVAE